MTAPPLASRVLRRAGDLALTLAAVVGALCLLLLLAGLVADVRPLVFRSGSMSPDIPTGSLALAREVPAGDVEVGDVVSVPYDDTRVTHRVVSVRDDGASVTLRLKGDANELPDPQPRQVTTVDRVFLDVPVLGRVVAWLSRPPGVFLLAGYAAALLVVLVRRRDEQPPRADRDPRRSGAGVRPAGAGRHGRGSARLAGRPTVVVLGLAGVLLTGAAPTWAYFGDRVAVEDSALASALVPAPTLSCGALGVFAVNFTWNAVPGASGYTLHHGPNASLSTRVGRTTSHSVTEPIRLGGAAYVVAHIGSWTSSPSNTVGYTVAAVSLCG